MFAASRSTAKPPGEYENSSRPNAGWSAESEIGGRLCLIPVMEVPQGVPLPRHNDSAALDKVYDRYAYY